MANPLNPRYAAFLTTGGEGSLAFMEFIQRAKAFAAERGMGVEAKRDKHYSEAWLTVVDHEAFTKACWIFALVDRIANEEAA